MEDGRQRRKKSGMAVNFALLLLAFSVFNSLFIKQN